MGYAYVVLFRKRPAYRFTVKHSIYVHHEHQGRGVGRLLLQELIDACAAAGFRQMIGYIDADNTASLALHEKFGFRKVGLLPASPIATAAGPTPSWCSVRWRPVQPSRHCYPASCAENARPCQLMKTHTMRIDISGRPSSLHSSTSPLTTGPTFSGVPE